MGLFESMLPDIISLTDEHFKTFLEKTMLTDFTRRILDGLRAQNAAAPITKPADTVKRNDTDEDADESNGEAETV